LLGAASVLARYEPDDPRWNELGPQIAERLVRSNPVSLPIWLDLFRPVRTRLEASLAAILRDRDPMRLESDRELAAGLLADYLGDQPMPLADILMACDPTPFATLLPVAQRQRDEVVPYLLAEIDKKLTPDNEPADSGADAERHTKRQARAAVAMFHMNRADLVVARLIHSADPRLRSFLINWLPVMRADPNRLAAELGSLDAAGEAAAPLALPFVEKVLFHPVTSRRRALILALGGYNAKDLPAELRRSLTETFLRLYRDDHDSGIHSATEWALRQWAERENLLAADAKLMTQEDHSERRWSVNTQGQTFAKVEGPVEFQMGSPPSEPHRIPNEILHRRIIPRRFAISTKEVTISQFERFLKDNPEIDPGDGREFSPDPGGPASKPSWYLAAAYCNWLSRQEHLRECYEPRDKDRFDEGMTIPADILTRNGYRLPTEAEWEFSCRAGARTSCYYGTSRELLSRFAWFNLNSEGRAWPCGKLLPNDLGMFDMLGNLYEWCQDPKSDYRPDADGVIVDQVTTKLTLAQTTFQILRGGGFVDVPPQLRSAHRFWNLPHNRLGSYGFRIARTLP
jgi:formylglycine-generating enzyme required for sulfatase activity